MAVRWEYHIETVPYQRGYERRLDSLGMDGWELVAVQGQSFYFKRLAADMFDTGQSFSESLAGEGTENVG